MLKSQSQRIGRRHRSRSIRRCLACLHGGWGWWRSCCHCSCCCYWHWWWWFILRVSFGGLGWDKTLGNESGCEWLGWSHESSKWWYIFCRRICSSSCRWRCFFSCCFHLAEFRGLKQFVGADVWARLRCLCGERRCLSSSSITSIVVIWWLWPLVQSLGSPFPVW